jgi:hypothetical protein
MKEEFVTYDQALALKELGFDEDCLGRWLAITEWEEPTGEIKLQLGVKVEDYDKNQCLAPLKQQVFRWFREKHDLWFRPDYYDEMREYDYQGSIHQLGRHSSLITLGNCKTVEELEAKCIDELIEIVKNK